MSPASDDHQWWLKPLLSTGITRSIQVSSDSKTKTYFIFYVSCCTECRFGKRTLASVDSTGPHYLLVVSVRWKALSLLADNNAFFNSEMFYRWQQPYYCGSTEFFWSAYHWRPAKIEFGDVLFQLKNTTAPSSVPLLFGCTVFGAHTRSALLKSDDCSTHTQIASAASGRIHYVTIVANRGEQMETRARDCRRRPLAGELGNATVNHNRWTNFSMNNKFRQQI